MGTPDTRDRILDAAEKLFADNGFSGTSLRAITGAAGANVAAVHYHFGSRDALLRAVFHRIVAPVNAERLRRFAELGDPPELEDLLRAFLAPPLDVFGSSDRGRILKRLVGRIFAEDDEVRAIFVAEFREVLEGFMEALQRTFPDRSAEDFRWPFHFMLGAMNHLLAHAEPLSSMVDTRRPLTPDAGLEPLVTWCAAGFRGTLEESP